MDRATSAPPTGRARKEQPSADRGRRGGLREHAAQRGRQLHQSTAFDRCVAVGLCAYGVVHLLIAGIAIRISATGTGSDDDDKGALTALSETPLGEMLLWATAFGLFNLVLWQIFETVWRRPSAESALRRRLGRAGSVCNAGSYLILGVSAVQVAADGRAAREGRPRLPRAELPPAVLAVIVVVIGVGLLVAAGRCVWRGVTRGFLDDLRPGVGRGVRLLGVVGYVGKGITIGILGVLVAVTGLQGDSGTHPGLNAALRLLNLSPSGGVLLVGKAAGIAAFGVYCFVWAARRRR